MFCVAVFPLVSYSQSAPIGNPSIGNMVGSAQSLVRLESLKGQRQVAEAERQHLEKQLRTLRPLVKKGIRPKKELYALEFQADLTFLRIEEVKTQIKSVEITIELQELSSQMAGKATPSSGDQKKMAEILQAYQAVQIQLLVRRLATQQRTQDYALAELNRGKKLFAAKVISSNGLQDLAFNLTKAKINKESIGKQIEVYKGWAE